jgi:hypothetical protein
MDVRKTTNKVLEMADEGLISYRTLAEMALKWMSEDDVAEMCKANELLPDDEEDEEDDEDEEETKQVYTKSFIRTRAFRVCPHCCHTTLADANEVAFCPLCGTPLL